MNIPLLLLNRGYMISEKEYLELLIIITESFEKLEKQINDRFKAIDTRMTCNEVWLKQIAQLLVNKK
jgi:hypothetical protein